MKKTLLFLVYVLPICMLAQVGIGTITPANDLDVNGWMTLGDQTVTGNNVEGSMRYNSTYKCMQFYDGATWQCIGRTKMQTHVLLDGIDETTTSGFTNNLTHNLSGYGTQFIFTVNDVVAGDNIVFLVDMTLGGYTRKSVGFSNSIKIVGNGIGLQEYDVPSTSREENFSTYIIGSPTVSGNLTFVFEKNMDVASIRITTIVTK